MKEKSIFNIYQKPFVEAKKTFFLKGKSVTLNNIQKNKIIKANILKVLGN